MKHNVDEPGNQFSYAPRTPRNWLKAIVCKTVFIPLLNQTRLGNEFLRRAFNCRHWWQDSGANASRRPAVYKTSNCCEMRPGIVQPINFLMILIVSYCFLMFPPGETISPCPFLSCPLQITIRKCTRSSCQKASKRRRFFSSKMWPSSCSEIWPSKLCDCRRILIARKWLQQTVRADLSVLLRIVRESNHWHMPVKSTQPIFNWQ